jgi:hypothetical protein
VPYAGDAWYLRRQKDANGEYFQALARQAGRKASDSFQGLYIATAEGTLLARFHHHPHLDRNLAFIQEGLTAWNSRNGAARVAADRPSPADSNFSRTPPEGGLVLKVFGRIPLPPESEAWNHNQAVSRDHMWITREEAAALLPERWEVGLAYPVPPAVAERLARFHLIDNIRGEPPMWGRSEVRRFDLTLRVASVDGRLGLGGSVRMHTDDPGDRGYEARVQGMLRYSRPEQRFEQVDLLAWGEAWGEGTYTRGAPPGRFPLLIALRLAGDEPADRVPPQAAREQGPYFRTGRS